MEIVNTINDILWTYVILAMLVGVAVYFTVRTRFVQFTMLPDMVRAILGRTGKSDVSGRPTHGKNIGPFQAFAVSLASRVGTGNLAGVASAIFIGGPGAVFWMWLMALLGAATAFVEATLAQLYKRRDSIAYHGGPAYYMQHGLHRRWMGIMFAVAITVTFGIANQMVQSTTICDSIADTFDLDKVFVGVCLTVSVAAVVFGGIRRISSITSVLVPFMAVGFILLSFVIALMHVTELPRIVMLVVRSAFGLEQVGGGMVGIAVLQGVKRGLFSNEAGEGSAPNAAALAETSHPVSQGLVQALGVFIDTLVICTCTAFIILVSGRYDCGKDGILLTAEALDVTVGSVGRYFITASIFLFAYSTMIANYFYGENNIRFITGRKLYVVLFRLVTAVVTMGGALLSLQEAFAVVDLVMGLMTLINLAAIIQLAPLAVRLLDDYRRQRREGREPVFHKSTMPDVESDIECWE